MLRRLPLGPAHASSSSTSARRAPRPLRRPASSASTSARPRPPPSSAFAPPPFRPPPISARLRPLVPFLLYWSLITSLAVHLLRVRTRAADELARAHAQVSVLERLVARARAGELGEAEVQRELEMVGLRERAAAAPAEADGQVGRAVQDLGELRDVGWKEVLLGRRRSGEAARDDEDAAVREWTKVVNEAAEAHPPTAAPPPPEPVGQARRAASSRVYL